MTDTLLSMSVCVKIKAVHDVIGHQNVSTSGSHFSKAEKDVAHSSSLTSSSAPSPLSTMSMQCGYLMEMLNYKFFLSQCSLFSIYCYGFTHSKSFGAGTALCKICFN